MNNSEKSKRCWKIQKLLKSWEKVVILYNCKLANNRKKGKKSIIGEKCRKSQKSWKLGKYVKNNKNFEIFEILWKCRKWWKSRQLYLKKERKNYWSIKGRQGR